jgi:hypothetical protein
MVKVKENDVKSYENREIIKNIDNNKNIYNRKNNHDGNINTYGGQKVKLYKYCQKCGKDFETPSLDMFCCWECRKEYYAEIRQDNDDCFGEWIGRD